MPIHIWSVLCERGVLDSYSNQVTIMNVIEQATIKPDADMVKALAEGKKVMLPVKVQIVSLWERSEPEKPERFQIRVVLTLPDGTEKPSAGTVDCDLVTHKGLRTFTSIGNLSYGGPGNYHYLVQQRRDEQAEWITAASLPVHIIVESETKEAGGAAATRATTGKRK